ncbi:hypothetical protein Emag_003251 [Eimeria magna]
MEVLYEDADLVVVNKPAGVPICPPSSNSGVRLKSTSIAERLRHHYEAEKSSETFRLFAQEASIIYKSEEDKGPPAAASPMVHRLDEGTSGVLMLAKTAEAGHSLRQQFKERAVKKVYLAVVLQGLLRKPMTVTSGVGRNSKNRRKMQTFMELPGVCTAGAHPETAKGINCTETPLQLGASSPACDPRGAPIRGPPEKGERCSKRRGAL